MDPNSEEPILEALRNGGYRLTRPRRAVVRVLLEAEDSLRPEDVHHRARRYCRSVGLVTVYRTLALLSEMDFIRRVHFEGGCHGYARAELAHGHHLVCRSCKQVIEFRGEENLSPMVERISQQTGFIVDDHLLELHGVCPNCQ